MSDTAEEDAASAVRTIDKVEQLYQENARLRTERDQMRKALIAGQTLASTAATLLEALSSDLEIAVTERNRLVYALHVFTSIDDALAATKEAEPHG